MPEQIPMLRNSERSTAKRCQHLWWWAWHEGLEKRGRTAPPLWFGTGVHLALATWYCGPGLKRGPHPAETWDAYAKDAIDTVKIPGLNEEDEDQFVNARDLGISMMENYVKTYGQDEHMDIIQPEQTFSLDVPWPKLPEGHLLLALAERRKILVQLVGTYDLVYRDLKLNQIWLEEHKTAASISTAHLSIDDQGGTYFATAGRALEKQGLIKKGERLRGIEYNFMRKGLPDPRPRNADGAYTNKPGKKHYHEVLNKEGIRFKLTTKLDDLKQLTDEAGLTVVGDVSKRQPSPLLLRERIHRTAKERSSQLRRIQNEAVQIELLRTGVIAPSKTPTRECSRFCSFFDLCELDERGGDTQEFKRRSFNKRDVYADHRKSTDE